MTSQDQPRRQKTNARPGQQRQRRSDKAGSAGLLKRSRRAPSAKHIQQQIAAAAAKAADNAVTDTLKAAGQAVAQQYPAVAAAASTAAGNAVMTAAVMTTAVAAVAGVSPLTVIENQAVVAQTDSAELSDVFTEQESLAVRVGSLETNQQVLIGNQAEIVESLTADRERITLALDEQGSVLSDQQETQAVQALDLIAQAEDLAGQSELTEAQAAQILTLAEEAAVLLADVGLLDEETSRALAAIRADATATQTELDSAVQALGVLDQELDGIFPSVIDTGGVVTVTGAFNAGATSVESLVASGAVTLGAMSDAQLAAEVIPAGAAVVFNTDRSRLEVSVDEGATWDPVDQPADPPLYRYAIHSNVADTGVSEGENLEQHLVFDPASVDTTVMDQNLAAPTFDPVTPHGMTLPVTGAVRVDWYLSMKRETGNEALTVNVVLNGTILVSHEVGVNNEDGGREQQIVVSYQGPITPTDVLLVRFTDLGSDVEVEHSSLLIEQLEHG